MCVPPSDVETGSPLYVVRVVAMGLAVGALGLAVDALLEMLGLAPALVFQQPWTAASARDPDALDAAKGVVFACLVAVAAAWVVDALMDALEARADGARLWGT